MSKNQIFATLVLVLLSISLHAQEPSAHIQFDSQDKGLLIPRMSSAQIAAIDSPADGLIVYDSSRHVLYFFNESKWQKISIVSLDMNNNLVAGSDTTRTGTNNTVYGFEAGQNNIAGNNNVSIGYNAGQNPSSDNTVAVGWAAGGSDGDYAVAVGWAAGGGSQRNAVAVGPSAGGSQGESAVAVGLSAGGSQGLFAVAVGPYAGATSQGGSAVAVGSFAGSNSQGGSAVAVGPGAGQITQGTNSVAVGRTAGSTSQGGSAVAVGYYAGQTNQGTNAVAIGQNAGKTDQVGNSIAINASGVALNPTNSGFYVDPIRQDSTTTTPPLVYNPTTKEITYGTACLWHLGQDTLGGIVFYIYKGSDGQQHGLIVSKTETTAQWQSTSSVTSSDRTWDGDFNTNLMTNSPAKNWIIFNFSEEWYIPSVDELSLLWQNRFHVNNALNAGGHTLLLYNNYWASLESSETTAWKFFFGDGGLSNFTYSKTETNNVRAIRAF